MPTINAVTLRARGANRLSRTNQNGGQCPPYNYKSAVLLYIRTSFNVSVNGPCLSVMNGLVFHRLCLKTLNVIPMHGERRGRKQTILHVFLT